ncbi:MAG: transcriptional regulator [Prevotellaceae bacterium]|jgi:DNA-binding MarR family transcriptional regulator|nr:transcriptional regulator [Prevotellaceae bacterium]
MFEELDPLLHSQLRLAVMSLLLGVDEADFVFLKEKTGATSGNLSVQIDKLNEAGYITVQKTFRGKMPRTVCKMTPKGLNALDGYVKTLQTYLSFELPVGDLGAMQKPRNKKK